MGSHQKKKKRTKDTRAVTSEIKRQQDLDANRLAIQPTFEGSSYAPRGVGVIEFCNVSTVIAASQTNYGGPGQVTGLTATTTGQTTMSLDWTTTPTATSYNVYISTVSGSESLMGSVTSSAALISLLDPDTLYFYQVSAVNAVGEGVLSTEISARTRPTLFAFNGTTDFITTPDSAALDLGTNFTVLAWINTSKDYTGTGTEGMIINKGGIGSDATGENMNYGIYILNAGNVARVSFETSAGVDSAATSGTAVNDGQDHMIVGTYNGTNLILYVDNQTPISTATTATPEINTKPLVVGRNSRASDRFFQGGIAKAQVWNRAWSAAEVSTYYNTVKIPGDASSSRVYLQTAGPTAPTISTLWLKFDNNLVDASGLNSTVSQVGSDLVYTTPGQFGTHHLRMNINYTGGDSTASYLTIPTNVNIQMDLTTVGFSIAFWIYPETFPGGMAFRAVVLHKCDNTSSPDGYSVEAHGTGELYFVVQRNSTTFYKQKITSLVEDAWQHIACTFNAVTSTLTIYKNGTDVSSVGTGSVVGAFGSSTSLHIGRHPTATIGGGDHFLVGYIDELQYFKGKVLTQAEATSLYNSNTI